jgi:hypothetical protein
LKEAEIQNDCDSFAAWALRQAIGMVRTGITGPAFQKNQRSLACIVKVADYSEKNKHFYITMDSSAEQNRVLASIQTELLLCSPKLADIKYEFVEFDNKCSIRFIVPLF